MLTLFGAERMVPRCPSWNRSEAVPLLLRLATKTGAACALPIAIQNFLSDSPIHMFIQRTRLDCYTKAVITRKLYIELCLYVAVHL